MRLRTVMHFLRSLMIPRVFGLPSWILEHTHFFPEWEGSRCFPSEPS